MDSDAFTRSAQDLAADAVAGCDGFAGVRIHEDARGHALAADRRAFVDVVRTEAEGYEGAPRWVLHVHRGSFTQAADALPDFDIAEMLKRAVTHGAQRLAEYAEAAQSMESEDALFGEHARFRRSLPVAPAWYSRGRRLAQGIWAVDLDIFVELTLPRSDWAALRGQRFELQVLGEELVLDVPEDADFDEAWSLEGAGLFEPAPGEDPEDLDEETPGRLGDLHVIPFVF